MFAIDLIKTIVTGSSLYQNNRANLTSLTSDERKEYYKSLGGISFDEPTYETYGSNNAKIANSIRATGTLPSIASVTSAGLTEIGAGYGFGRLTGKSQRQIERDGSLPVDDIKQLIWIPLVSSFVSTGLEHFLFEKYLGNDFGGIKIPLNKANKAIISHIEKDANLGNDIHDISKTAIVIEDKAKYTEALEGTKSAAIANAAIMGTSFLANAYHGYHRHNQSKSWGLVWGMFGNLGLALSQGYGQEIKVMPTKVLMTSPLETVMSNPYVKPKAKTKSKSSKKTKSSRSKRSKK